VPCGVCYLSGASTRFGWRAFVLGVDVGEAETCTSWAPRSRAASPSWAHPPVPPGTCRSTSHISPRIKVHHDRRFPRVGLVTSRPADDQPERHVTASLIPRVNAHVMFQRPPATHPSQPRDHLVMLMDLVRQPSLDGSAAAARGSAPRSLLSASGSTAGLSTPLNRHASHPECRFADGIHMSRITSAQSKADDGRHLLRTAPPPPRNRHLSTSS